MENRKVKDALDTLEAERLIETVKLRNELVREARALLPLAIRQAKPGRRSKKFPHGRPGSPALLRLIARLAMRDVRLDKSPK